ncbi:Apoptosis facilitator Bcl-2-like protein 14 [Channa argus]|uniref:Apoptosis facilitator Bcl-2-like protein 14 n=1 Tax=Channa argus TaxID=215402 RepID=A0A6G1QSS7_CHAAH|nr:Apoptosis facilitator Bcl-2-like protein 14 [Channa argus]KAK2882905.1 hypothetical protein Q8A73_021838 [Channa argus]
MANGVMEIHDPFCNHSNLKSSTDCDRNSTSGTSDMENMVEFRILMAYATRRRPNKDSGTPVSLSGKTDQMDANGTAPSQTDKKVTAKKKKNKAWKRVLRFLKCIQPQTEKEEPDQTNEKQYEVEDRCAGSRGDEKEEQDELADVANRLTRIADDIPFPPEIECDAPVGDENVEMLIGLILRESGDRLNEQELKNVRLARELFWNYGFFKEVMTAVLTRMGIRSRDPESPGPHASPQTQMAVTCEATCRLSTLDTMPTSQVLGFGAKYVNEYFSDWAQQHGGYKAAFKEDEDEDEDEDVQ